MPQMTEDDKHHLGVVLQSGAAAVMIFLLIIRALVYMDSQTPMPEQAAPVHHSNIR